VVLDTRGEPVLPVPTKLMAETRRGARTRGKSDSIDAIAIALARAAHRREWRAARRAARRRLSRD